MLPRGRLGGLQITFSRPYLPMPDAVVLQIKARPLPWRRQWCCKSKSGRVMANANGVELTPMPTTIVLRSKLITLQETGDLNHEREIPTMLMPRLL